MDLNELDMETKEFIDYYISNKKESNENAKCVKVIYN